MSRVSFCSQTSLEIALLDLNERKRSGYQERPTLVMSPIPKCLDRRLGRLVGEAPILEGDILHY
jgi:hypothetical protein